MGLETVLLAVVPSQRLARASRVPLSDGTVPRCAPCPRFPVRGIVEAPSFFMQTGNWLIKPAC